jgi:hypothetical protein
MLLSLVFAVTVGGGTISQVAGAPVDPTGRGQVGR